MRALLGFIYEVGGKIGWQCYQSSHVFDLQMEFLDNIMVFSNYYLVDMHIEYTQKLFFNDILSWCIGKMCPESVAAVLQVASRLLLFTIMDSSSPPPAEPLFSRMYPQNQSYNFSHDTNSFLDPNLRGQMSSNRHPAYSQTLQSRNDVSYAQNATTPVSEVLFDLFALLTFLSRMISPQHQNSSTTSNSFALSHNSQFSSQMIHILATASHFDLIQAQNPAYTQLQMDSMTLTNENRLLREKLMKAEIQCHTNE